MYKKFVFFIIAIVLIVITVVAGLSVFRTTGQEMECAELFHEGDYSVVEDAEFDITGYVNETPKRMEVWKTKIVLGSKIQKDTEFQRNVKSLEEAGIQTKYSNSSIMTDPLGDIKRLVERPVGVEKEDPLYCSLSKSSKKLNPRYEKVLPLIEETLKDLHRSCFKTHKLKDLMEYYPFGNMMILKYKNGEPSAAGYDLFDYGYLFNTYDSKEEEHMIEGFQENFKIPVPEDIEVSFSVSAPDSKALELDYVNESDKYSVHTVNAETKENLYFTFDTHTLNNKVVDTSELTYGYGIYSIPFNKEKSKVPVDIDKVKNIFPLNPEVKVLNLQSDGKKNLFLTYNEEGKTWYSVIDIETGQSRETILLDNYPWDFVGNDCRTYEDFHLIDNGLEDIYLLSKDSKGIFETPVKFKRKYRTFNADFPIQSADFDGERLILAGQSDNGFKVSVYNRNGIIFYGKYKTGVYVDELSVKWKEK